jgi:WD40 repeat protein
MAHVAKLLHKRSSVSCTAQDGPVSEFKLHAGYVTGLQWCPYEGSMLLSCGSDNQLAVRWLVAGSSSPASCASLFYFARIRGKNWGFGLALERILAWRHAAAVSEMHEVHPIRPCCPS